MVVEQIYHVHFHTIIMTKIIMYVKNVLFHLNENHSLKNYIVFRVSMNSDQFCSHSKRN